ncbi:MAG: uracil-DNA glycosylase [Candidatus Competibacteraceae bacterium]
MSKRHRDCLDLMGIPLWELRRPLGALAQRPATEIVATVEAAIENPAPVAPTPVVSEAPPASAEPSIEPSVQALFPPDTAPAPAPEPAPRDGRTAAILQMDWETLQAAVRDCTACGLCAGRTQTVFGVGDRRARWLIVGEAPGADEDRLGEPFVGRAGKLLDEMLKALRLKRQQVYIANILKCRPPENRDPAPEEARCCWPFLERQIQLIRPKMILAVGRIAAQMLLQTDVAIGKLRGRVYRLSDLGIPVVVSYHPAYLLRSPREKRKSWDDLQLARRTLNAELHTAGTAAE